MLFLSETNYIPVREIYFDFVRSSGPGGQNVNKVNSKAQLRWNVWRNQSLPEPVRARFLARFHPKITKSGEVLITSDRFRDRGRNQEDCLEKLRQMLATVAVAPKPRKKTKPSRHSQEKRRTAKRRHGEKKRNRTSKSWIE